MLTKNEIIYGQYLPANDIDVVISVSDLALGMQLNEDAVLQKLASILEKRTVNNA